MAGPGQGTTAFAPAAPRRRRSLAARLARGLAWLLAGLVVTAGAAWAGIEYMIARLGPPPLERAEATSVTVLDREDRLLRAFTTPDGRWRLAADAGDVDPRYLRMLIAFEDKRFHRHNGIDPFAVLRAAVQLVRNGRIVSGGSTLTMQVARLLDGSEVHSLGAKFWQILRALQLERLYGKPEILRLYLTLAPFGGNVEGVRAASLAYFGKEPRRLSVGEAALLVALPQSPELRRPDRHAARARYARDRVLGRALTARIITADEAHRARAEPVPTARREFPKLAAHLAEAEAALFPARRIHRLTIDARLQRDLEVMAAEHIRVLGQRLSTAILVVDHLKGEIAAHVGSAGYLDDERFGAIDMTRILRSPGSTLKPIIYGLAFELGLAHPETLIEDRSTRFGTYAPKNFDEEFHGTVTMREALTQSLNIPAVKVLEAVGPGRLTGRLRRIGLVPVLPGKGEPTLAIALGGIGLKLSDLAQLYAALARGGEALDLVHRREVGPRRTIVRRPVRRLMSRLAAWYVADILKDAPPPLNARRGLLGYKTGTSYGYRDAWAIGFDGRYTIAVWVGRPDATATPGLTGRIAAAPILFDAFGRIGERRTPLPAAPAEAIIAATSALPAPLRSFREAAEIGSESGYLDQGVQIAYPPDRAEIETEPGEAPRLVLKAEGGALPLTWLIDGQPIASPAHAREAEWQADGRGFVRVSVIDAKGRVDRVVVRIR